LVLSDISVKRPVLATVISLLIVVLGGASLLQLPVREYPDIDPPVVSVRNDYISAAPEVVDTEITEVIESAISGVDGIRLITSESRTGRGQTTIGFNQGRDVDAAANDVRDAISRVVRDLPADAEAPVVSKADADARPMLWITLASEALGTAELTDFAERNLVDRLSVLDGVASVSIGGQRRYAMRVWLDRQAMAARDITVEEVEQALRRGNVELPSGRIESLAREFSVRTDTRLALPEEFRELVVKRTGDYQIRLGEIARIERGIEDDSTIVRADGRASVGLGVVRQSQANIITVSDLVQAEVDTIRASLPPGIEIGIAYDESVFIREAVREILIALGIAVGLVILIIFVFLRSVRATFVPAVTIPVAVIGAFTVMAGMGFSINVLTLLALILAIGLVVDDAIVMLENIQRRIDEGERPLLAAYRGARQVAFAIIATTLTLVAVFVPISFMQGNVGRLFTEFGFVLAAAVLFSSLVALTLAPMLCSKWLKPGDSSARLVRATEGAFRGLGRGYRWCLEKALQVPIVVMGLAGLVSVAAYALFVLVPEELVPTEDRGVIIIPSNAPQGSTPGYTDGSVRQIEALLEPLRESGEADRIFSIVGFGGQYSRGFTIVGLAPWSERERPQQAIAGEIFPLLAQVPGVRAFAVNPPGLGLSPFQAPVQLVISGPDYQSLAEWQEQVLARLADNPRLLNVNSNYEETLPQLRIAVDRRRAADLEVPLDQIGRTLQSMIASRTVTGYLDRGREYDVILQTPPEDRATPGDLSNIFVRSGNAGALVPLSSLITLEESGAPPQLNRVDRMRSVTVSASLAPGYSLAEALADIEAAAREVLPSEARTGWLGESLEFQETTGAIYLTFALALLIVFLVLAAQFESFVHPFIIILSVPLAVTGALGALVLSGITLNIYSQIGMILLIGLMAKNGILIVEFANQLRDQGRSIREAIVLGSVLRFRPILMTAISTVFGALPLVLASGAGAESRAAIGIVIIGGLAFATILTLFVIPVLYDLLARFTSPVNAVATELDRLERDERQAASGDD
jgi:multidrug efflux pump